MSKQPSVVRQESRRIIINDASCLIDLHKVGLLQEMLKLPFEFHVALPVRMNELISIMEAEWAALDAAGIVTIDLPGELVREAVDIIAAYPELSSEDSFSLVLARSTPNALLLTGDRALRTAAAEGFGIEVHGVLWVSDLLEHHGIVAPDVLGRCLCSWRDDPLVRLPPAELAGRITRLTQPAHDNR